MYHWSSEERTMSTAPWSLLPDPNSSPHFLGYFSVSCMKSKGIQDQVSGNPNSFGLQNKQDEAFFVSPASWEEGGGGQPCGQCTQEPPTAEVGEGVLCPRSSGSFVGSSPSLQKSVQGPHSTDQQVTEISANVCAYQQICMWFFVLRFIFTANQCLNRYFIQNLII